MYLQYCFLAFLFHAAVCDKSSSDESSCFNVDAVNYVRVCLNAGVLKLAARGTLFDGKDDFNPFEFPVKTDESITYNVKIEDASISLVPPVHVLKEGEWSGDSKNFQIYTEYYTGDFTQKYKFTATDSEGRSYRGTIEIAVSGYQVSLLKQFILNEDTNKYEVTDVKMEPTSYGSNDYKIKDKIREDLKSAILEDAKSKDLLKLHNTLGNTMLYYETVDPPDVDIM